MPSHRPAIDRFMEKVRVEPNGCWSWTAGHNKKGYAMFSPDRIHKSVVAYKWYWEYLHVPVPKGFVLDHIECDNTGCVNPDHLYPTTSQINTLRSSRTMAHRWASRATCDRGHQWTETAGRRVCNKCRSEKRYEQIAAAREG